MDTDAFIRCIRRMRHHGEASGAREKGGLQDANESGSLKGEATSNANARA